MASPQLEDGYTRIANEILEKIISNRSLSAKELRVILHVIRKTYGFEKKRDWISISQFMKAVGGDRASMCRTLKRLVAHRLLVKTERDYGFNKNWEQWIVAAKPLVAKRSMGSGRTVNGVVAHRPPTKERITKENNTKDKQQTAEPSAQGVQEVLKEFYKINSATQFGSPPQRKAASELIGRVGLEQLLGVIQSLPTSNLDRFSPKIYSPTDLRNKWAALADYWARKKETSNSRFVDITDR